VLDLLLNNARIIDGTGKPSFSGAVGVRSGVIVALGEIDEPAERSIDVGGRVVCPGFVDIHTHYDAQLCWDPYASPSSSHGVTTVIGGNCGFSIAPISDIDHDYMAKMLARVEGMPLETLQAAVPWDWTSFREYLDRFEGQLAVNAGFFVGHTAIRRHVLGADSEREAAPGEVDAMIAVLHESLAAGAMGLSTGTSPTHNDAAGRPVTNRFASRDEFVALAGAVGQHEGTALEFVPPPGEFAADQVDLMASMSAAADRPLNWNLLNVSMQIREACEQRLRASDHAAAIGGRVLALTLPGSSAMRLNFVSGFLIDALPVFSELFELDLAERRRVLASPEARALLRRCVDSTQGRALYYLTDWGGLTIGQTFDPANAGLDGRLVRDIAAEWGVDPFDALLDVVVADDLRTVIVTPLRGDDDESWALRQSMVRDPRTVVGGSDSGAHVDMLDTFALTTTLIGPTVRDRGTFSLEEAIHSLTGAPRDLYGLRDRGTIAVGAAADLIVFDPDTAGPGTIEFRDDLPAGASRLYSEPTGIGHVFVNGVEIITDNVVTGALPGAVLRSGRDTRTVRVADIPAPTNVS
jgi:N-acyl-D-aspartate/D-glutamate deacylase